MHSLSGIRHKYPYIEEYLPFLYGQTFENKNQESFQIRALFLIGSSAKTFDWRAAN